MSDDFRCDPCGNEEFAWGPELTETNADDQMDVLFLDMCMM
jgi:hypothetical protein